MKLSIQKNKIHAYVLAAALLFSLLAGCGRAGKEISTGKVGVFREESSGKIYLDLSIEDFNALGFSFGDSVDISVSNGKSYQDVPYYSGYYTPIDGLLVCGYPGAANVLITRNYGSSTWEEFGMSDSAKATVTLNEKGKYLPTEELCSLRYSDERADFDSDVIFVNFREFRGGAMKPQTFYRSASPCDNQHQRASCANALAEANGIRFVLNLSDNAEEYSAHTQAADFDSAYYDALCRDGGVLLLDLDANYRSEEFTRIISEALLTMTEHDGPCLIHCVEGKDRTGFVCALMIALAGASAQEIIDDYMITYDNYYGIRKEDAPERYEAVRVNVDDFLYFLCGVPSGTPIETMDLKAGAEAYLRRGGLNDGQIAQIEAYLAL